MAWNNFGITPLMATFVLISFAIALGVGIMSFAKAEVEEGAQCPLSIGLRLASIGEVKQLCYDAAQKQVSFVVENGVNTAVSGLIVSVIGDTQADTFELATSIPRAGSYVGTVPYDADVAGEIRQIKITPQMTLEESLICLEEALVFETVRVC